MRDSTYLTEQDLERIERGKDPGVIPHLVSTIREQQHELDGLRLGMDVARRDREELRMALISARAEIERLRGGTPSEPTGRGEG